MDFRGKMAKLLAHWAQHNQDHMAELEKWLREAEREQETELAHALAQCLAAMAEVGQRLQAAGRLTGSPDPTTDAPDHHHH